MITIPELEEKSKIKFTRYQIDFIENGSPRLVGLWSRKAGKTECIGAKIAMKLSGPAFPSRCDGIGVTSLDMKASREIISKVRQYLAEAGYVFERHLIAAINKGAHYASRTEIWIRNENGAYNKVCAYACGHDGQSIRPWSFIQLYRDEDVFSPEGLDAAADATLQKYGEQEIRTSMGGDPTGSFYDMVKEGKHDTGTFLSVVPYYQVPWLTKEKIERARRKLGKILFAQEYGCEFLADRLSVIAPQLISIAQDWSPDWAQLQRLPCYIGVDYARFGDDENCIAFCFYNAEENICHIRIKKITSTFRVSVINDMVISYANRFNAVKVVTDDTGIGGTATDYLVRALGPWRVTGVTNNRKVEDSEGRRRRYIKMDLYSHLISRLETRTIKLDPDRAIKYSLLSMKLKYTEGGETTIWGRDNHAAEAIVRAIHPLVDKRALSTDDLGVVFIP